MTWALFKQGMITDGNTAKTLTFKLEDFQWTCITRS